ncbi:MAG: hypothetical protein A3J74_04220 [Elusimicrobia bacterium RIFCSPHIGHO2_02_FULL_57_9]|nr:MAG: hypothetical protein A3J74_04220 [Elusimicrobia bacterium RIFCSPHIGHO2_02_FULL_57_9]
MNFIDKVRIFVTGGDGGNGCLAFLREKFMEFGGPNGGDGGKGGDVYLVASPHLSTLLDLSLRPHIEGKPGNHGKGSDKTGSAGSDMVVLVPVGTVVYKDGCPEVDLARAGARYLAARGGRGGRGNLSFKTRLNTAPRLAEKGEPGERVALDLQLKLIADVGLVGFPNAGKSSLLARISQARPKVADYPFTTLAPNLGVASHKGIHFVVADIPGIIAGAHRGKGLGMEFLRHVERARVLVHLIDPAGYGNQSLLEGIKAIEAELKAFSSRLAVKPRILVLNKMDLPESADALKQLKARQRARRPLGISAATGAGVSALLDRIILELSRRPVADTLAPAPFGQVARVDTGFRVEPLGGGRFELKGRFVERAAAMLDSSLPEALDRFQKTLKRIGVDKALRLAAVQEGDFVRCGVMEFEWSDQPYRSLPRARRNKRTRIGVGRK